MYGLLGLWDLASVNGLSQKNMAASLYRWGFFQFLAAFHRLSWDDPNIVIQTRDGVSLDPSSTLWLWFWHLLWFAPPHYALCAKGSCPSTYARMVQQHTGCPKKSHFLNCWTWHFPVILSQLAVEVQMSYLKLGFSKRPAIQKVTFFGHPVWHKHLGKHLICSMICSHRSPDGTTTRPTSTNCSPSPLLRRKRLLICSGRNYIPPRPIFWQIFYWVFLKFIPTLDPLLNAGAATWQDKGHRTTKFSIKIGLKIKY